MLLHENKRKKKKRFPVKLLLSLNSKGIILVQIHSRPFLVETHSPSLIAASLLDYLFFKQLKKKRKNSIQQFHFHRDPVRALSQYRTVSDWFLSCQRTNLSFLPHQGSCSVVQTQILKSVSNCTFSQTSLLKHILRAQSWGICKLCTEDGTCLHQG